jgi:hypothetical protein
MASAESLGGDKTMGKLRLGVASGGKIPKSFHFFGEFAVRTTVSVDISGTTGTVATAPFVPQWLDRPPSWGWPKLAISR